MSDSETPKAFAAAASGVSGDYFEQEGMDLRDWFAGQALVSAHMPPEILNSVAREQGKEVTEVIAIFAYHIADVMLAVRERSSE